MPNYDAAQRAMLRKVGSVLRSSLKFHSPGERSSLSWVMSARASVVDLINRDIGAWATETNARHPVFARGPRRDWTWVNENVHKPELTHWADRAVDEVIQDAAESGLDEYLRGVTITSEYFEYRG